MTNYDHAPPSIRPFSDAAIGAVVALIRAVELYDPAVAHRAALRSIVAAQLVRALESDSNTGIQDDEMYDPAEVIATSALADIDLAVSRPADPEASGEPTRSMLGATIVSRLPGLRNVSTAIARRNERWDEAGSDLPLSSRVTAVADCLVGNPAAGFVPTWDHALRRVRRNRANVLDPALCDALTQCNLDDIEAPPIPSAAILDLLENATTGDGAEAETDTATTIRAAVAAAAHASELMTLFAATAQRTANAAEILIWPFAETELAQKPIAAATDGQNLVSALERLTELRDFAVQAELRAGVTITPGPVEAADDEPDAIGDATDVVMPIMTNDEAWGILVASRRPDEAGFDRHDLSVLRHVASEAAEAVSSTAHWAEIERMALRDQLTGLANRHVLYQVLDAIFEQPPLERIDTALIMCDVDGLKVVNDTLGHQAGDRLLKDAAQALRGAVRDPERTTVCRIGGDEFCMVIEGGALLTAHEVSDMIERLFARSAGSGPPRSISCGIAFAGEDIDSRSALLRAADENQYQTKRARKVQREQQAAEIAAASPNGGDRRAIRD